MAELAKRGHRKGEVFGLVPARRAGRFFDI